MDQHGKLKWAFRESPSFFELLTTLRSRRVGRGYRVDSGSSFTHPVTGRAIQDTDGPMRFISHKEPLALTRVEEALLCWAACGPTGLVTFDTSVAPTLTELTWICGRTVPGAGNTQATDLLVINDSGAFIYKPTKQRTRTVEIQGEDDYDKVLRWYDEGLLQFLDRRPDVDHALRAPGAPNAALMGPYQLNLNLPGGTWFIPLTDAAWLQSVLVNQMNCWHYYIVDEWNGGRPAGVAKWVREGMLEFPVTIAAQEQTVFQIESYPTGCMVQNIRLAAEAMGLGAWSFCGFSPEILMGAVPEITRGLGFQVEAPNPRAPVSTGQIKIFGIEGVKEATYVPSPRYKDGAQLVKAWYDEKYAPGRTLHRGEDNYLRKVGSPWNRELTDRIINDPRTRPAEWVWEALIAYIDYCVEHFGQWPVTYNPMQAHFGTVIHHVDEEFYDRYYKEGYITDRIRNRAAIWGE